MASCGTSTNSVQANYQWKDITNNILIGNQAFMGINANPTQTIAQAIYTALTNVVVALTNAVSANSYAGTIEGNLGQSTCSIVQISSGGPIGPTGPTGTGNVNAIAITGATNKALMSLNDTATSIGLVLTASQKQSFAKSSGGIGTFTTTEVNQLSWTANDVIYNITEFKFLKYTASETWVDANASVGQYRQWANSLEGFGWLKCIGQNVSRTTYDTLFNVIGTAFGSGDGSTTFTLPDFRSSVFGDVGQKIISNTFEPTDINITSDVITLTNIDHLYTGTPIVFSTTGTVPSPLVNGNTYYVIKESATTIRLATTVSNAKA